MILLIGLLFLVVFTFFIGFFNGMAFMFFDAASIIIFLAPLIFFFAITKSGKTFTDYIKSSFKKNYEYSVAELENISMAAKHSIKITLAAGCFGFIIGIIGMLFRLDDPHTIGPLLALGLLTILYSIGVGFFILFPLYVWAKNKKQAG